MKSGKHIDAVQTMRNWILAASFLATGALSLLVALPTYCNAVGEFIPKGDLLGWKLLCLMICCLGAFFCFAQSIRYFNHTVIMVNCQMGGDDYWNLLDGIDILRDVDIAASNAGNVLNRGCNFFTLGLRFFYTTFPLLMWLYGPWFLLGTTILLVAVFWHMDGTIGVKKSIVKRRMSVVNSRQDIELANLR